LIFSCLIFLTIFALIYWVNSRLEKLILVLAGSQPDYPAPKPKTKNGNGKKKNGAKNIKSLGDYKYKIKGKVDGDTQHF